MSVGMQMVELPHGADGLSWIISQQPQQLLLIPGLQAASITAAAAGDQEALSYLRFVAQFAAAHRSMLNLSELDTCCLLAAELIPADGQVAFDIELSGSSPEIRDAFYGRQRCTKELLSKAVQQGQLAALQCIRALCHQIHGDDKGLMEHAARRSSVELMMFLSSGSRPAPWDEDVLEQAIKHPSCLQWLLSRPRPHPCYSDILQQAAKHESLEALKVLHAGKLPSDMWNARVCSSAAAHPNGLCMLQWLRAQQPPIPWDEQTCARAASKGNLGLLQWLRAQDPPAPWGVTCTAAAARADNLSLLRWLQAQDPPCPWDISCTNAAATAGSVSILQWLRAQEPPCPWDPATCATQAARYGRLDVL